MIELYSQPGCGQCIVTERWFDKRGLVAGQDYTVHNVRENPEAAQAVRDMGYDGTPVVRVDENTHWKGFQPALLATLAEGAPVY